MSKEEKEAELAKYRDLVQATIDYYLENQLMKFKTADFDSETFYKSLKVQTEECFNKGQLTKLKQWFRNLTEMQVETGDSQFSSYLQERTGYKINTTQEYINRIEKIIKKGKITTDNQFREVNSMVNQLSQTEPIDEVRISSLNKLLAAYELTRSRNK